jgi:hypothetical protein
MARLAEENGAGKKNRRATCFEARAPSWRARASVSRAGSEVRRLPQRAAQTNGVQGFASWKYLTLLNGLTQQVALYDVEGLLFPGARQPG